jgi:hypothetical protein
MAFIMYEFLILLFAACFFLTFISIH